MRLTEQGTENFIAYHEWDEYCYYNHIQDPWKIEEEIKDEYRTMTELRDEKGKYLGMSVKYDEPTEDQIQRLNDCYKYRDEYITMRELWVGRYLLENFGYNALSIFAQAQLQETALQEWFAQVKPCEGADGQCSLDCPSWAVCAIT